MVEIKKETLDVAETKLFPVYRFTVSYEDEDGKKREVDYTETMCSHELTDDECREKINELMTPFMKMYPKAEGKIILIEFKEVQKADWRLIWFSHETFQKFKSEAEAFASFRAFVHNAVKECRATGKNTACLMGADESERWTICDCENCKKTGRTVINH